MEIIALIVVVGIAYRYRDKLGFVNGVRGVFRNTSGIGRNSGSIIAIVAFLIIAGALLYFFVAASPESVGNAKNTVQNFGPKNFSNTQLFIVVGGVLLVGLLLIVGFSGVRRMAGNTLVTVFLILAAAFVVWVYSPENTFNFLEKWWRSIILFCISVAAFAYTKNLVDRYNTWTTRYTLTLILWLGSAVLFLFTLFNS